MRTLKLTLAYDGTNYVGWQRQANGLSVQQVVEEAFAPLIGSGEPPTVAGAGRTDAGVHALGQVASVNARDRSAPPRPSSARSTSGCRPTSASSASSMRRPGFTRGFTRRARRIATASRRRRCCRRSIAGSCGTRRSSRASDRMQAAAAALVGRHDFASFQAGGAIRARTRRGRFTRSTCARPAASSQIEIDGDGFLRHMVRTIVGTLAEIGAGQRPVDDLPRVLAARDRRAAGQTAPACGLTLMRVDTTASGPDAGSTTSRARWSAVAQRANSRKF